MIIFVFGLILLTGSLYAQKTVDTTKFTSVYTNLDKDCKTLKGVGGTDDASDCQGIGGYRLRVWFSAASQMIGADTPDKKDTIHLITQGLDFDQTKVKVEWRLANGKPFAVIMRVFKYSDETTADNPYFGKKIGEELAVMGLKGFDGIDFKVDTKTPDANAKARELADNGYKQK